MLAALGAYYFSSSQLFRPLQLFHTSIRYLGFQVPISSCWAWQTIIRFMVGCSHLSILLENTLALSRYVLVTLIPVS